MQNIDWTALAKAYFESNGLALRIKSRHVISKALVETDVFTVAIVHGVKHDAIRLQIVSDDHCTKVVHSVVATSSDTSAEACKTLLSRFACNANKIRVDHFDGPGGCIHNGGHDTYKCLISNDECDRCSAGMKFVESTWLEQFGSEEEMLLKLSVRAQ